MFKPAILLIGNFLSAQGRARGVSEDLASTLSAAGWPVRWASEKPGRLAKVLDMVGAVWRWRDEYAVAHVEVYSGPAFRWAELTCGLLRRLGKPYLLTLHGGDLPTFAQRHPERVRRLLRSAVNVTTPSRYLLEQLVEYRADLRLLPNPLRLAAYRFRPRTRPTPRLLWLRAFHTLYNPALALHALAQLKTDYPAIHLAMAGPDKGDGCRQAMQQIVAELKLADCVALRGAIPKPEVPAFLEQGDIFLNTTNTDNAPVSVLEAMACGLCIVSTNVGGIPYLLEHEHDALLVPPADPLAMAAAVSRILSDSQLAERLSHNARRKAEQFDWATILPLWEGLLQETAQTARRV